LSKNRTYSTQPEKERAFLFGVEIFDKPVTLSISDSLNELALLADTAGLVVVGQASQKLDRPNPATLIGSGKVEELKILIAESIADLVIFDDELSPRHLRELEEAFGNNVRVIDRTSLILDIFAQHAKSSEGKLQVELAQYEYLYPRLTRAWTHLARQAGGGAGRTGSVGGVGLRGPGETQLEVDRRQIRSRISFLKDELEKVRVHRKQYRIMRKKSQIPVIALVGYTNAGKSTLLNRLTKSDVPVADKLFATLDPTTRRLQVGNNKTILITDTVGFIQKLPTQLIAAFRATLEEISEADLLLLVVDSSHSAARAQYYSVQNTLELIDSNHIPIITVLNKIDKLTTSQSQFKIRSEWPDAIPVSALTGEGIENLLQIISQELFETLIPVEVKLPYKQGYLISLFHRTGQIEKIEQGVTDVKIKGSLPGRLISEYLPFITKRER
jgi:GTP-binding protein HflX